MRWARPESTKTDPRMIKAADWLMSKEVRNKGDWSMSLAECAAGRMVLRVQQ